MNLKTNYISSRWGENINLLKATEEDINKFHTETGLTMPNDLIQYFKELNGTIGYEEDLFKFNSLVEFQSVEDEFKDWTGSPNYTNLINTLSAYRRCFVMGNYCFHAVSYAIELHSNPSIESSVYVLSGDRYKIIARSFSEYMDLYLGNSIKLLFEDDK
jgi:hypothetical protein